MTNTTLLHRCGPSRRKTVAVGTEVERLPYHTVDIHCHLFTPAIEETVADHPARQAEISALSTSLGKASVELNRQMFASLAPKLTCVNERLTDMAAMGVDIQAISPSPTQYYYWAEPDLAQELITRQNDEVTALCEAHPERFIGFGTVAMQHPALASKQLESLLVDRGFKGVQISSLVGERDIADPYFAPFWAKADELGAVVFIHPWGTTLGPRLAEHYLMNVIGQPFETTLALSKLILSGTLDRYPDVKIIAAHGGGYLPLHISRMDHAYMVRTDAGCCDCLPSDYLQRIWFDSVVHDTAHLSQLIDAVGVNQIMLGSDYPFDMGHYDPGTLLAPFEADIQRAILGENATRLLNININRESR